MKKQGRRSWLLVSTLASLVAGCGDGEPARKAEAPTDSGMPADVADARPAGQDSGGPALGSDAGVYDAAVTGEPDAGVVVPPSEARCALDETSIADGSLWKNGWTFHYDDPAGDDNGGGSYIYPTADMAGGADLRSVDLGFDAKTKRLSVSVGLAALKHQTRVGIILWDRTHFQKELKNLEWALSGVEMRVPNWSRNGVAFVLALPKRINPLFDLTFNAASSTGRRSDNSISIQTTNFEGGDDVKWLDCWGKLSNSPTDVMELSVEPNTVPELEAMSASESKTLSFDIPASVLSSYIGVNDTSGGLAIVVYSFLVVSSTKMGEDQKFNEYGAFEITGQLGGSLDSEEGDRVWRDPDTYDIAFVELTQDDVGTALQKQNAILTPPPIGLNEAVDFNKHLVILTEASSGVGIVDTSGGGI